MNPTSGLYPLNEDQIAERGARMARRDDREYREYLREEQRSQPGCPAREVGLDQPIQATRRVDGLESHVSHYLALVERGLFALAAILLGWYFLQHAITAYEQAAANRELESVHLAVDRPASAVPRLTAGALIGRVQIPRVGVSAIVREGDDAATLRHAVGHIPDTALPGEPGNAGLAGHRDTFFRALKSVRQGDRITITIPGGVLEYVVRHTTVVDPDDVSVLSPTGHQTLTLVTCYPFYYIGSAPRRFIVQAELAQDQRQ